MPLVNCPKTLLLLPIGSNIVKENSDRGKDFTITRGTRNYRRRHLKGPTDNGRERKCNGRSIGSGPISPVRNFNRALKPAGIIQNTTLLQGSEVLFQTG
jgi:hypothetical protein